MRRVPSSEAAIAAATDRPLPLERRRRSLRRRSALAAAIVGAVTGLAFLPGLASAAGLGASVVDPAFDPDVNGEVEEMAVQADGKVLVAGFFSTAKGRSLNHLARFNSDGTLDTSFDAGITGNGLTSVAVQADGKIVIGGKFTQVGTTSVSNIARLNADGTADTSFRGAATAGPGGTEWVHDITVLPSGRMYITGEFACVGGPCASGGVTRRYVARLEADGRPDESFDAGIPFTQGWVTKGKAAIPQPDGKVVVAGNLSCLAQCNWSGSPVTGVLRNGIARFNADGSLDGGFNPNVTNNGIPGQGIVNAAVLLADGDILVGGDFNQVGATSRDDLARINADGTLDTALPDLNLNNWVYDVAIQADGKAVIVGDFDRILGAPVGYGVARLNADGASVDPGFAVNVTGLSWRYVNAAVLQPDGRLLLGGGGFAGINGVTRNNAARIGTGSGPAVGPGAVTAVAGNAEATVSWTALPGEITSYTATSSPGGKTCTVAVPTTTCTVTGLTNGTEYTFTVAAANEFGTGVASSPSSAVTPSAPVVSSPSGGGSSNAVMPEVKVPAALAKAGIPVAVNGTMRLPLVCPAGIPGNCDASGVLSMTLPGSVRAERGAGEHAKSRVRTLATFRGVQIASGTTRLHSVRLAPKTYNALRKAGIRRVPADLRTTNRLAGGDPINSQQRIWLKILPLKKAPKVVPVTG